MSFSCLCSLCVLLVLFGRLALPATELGVTSSLNSTPTYGVSFGSPTPPPGVTGTPEDATQLSASETPTAVTETRSPTTEQTVVSTEGCLCDLTPDFCDLGCCCDRADCDVANLNTVFTGCPKKDVSGVCIEKWLMFRANVNSSRVTVTDTLFCIQVEGADAPRSPSAPTHFLPVGDSYDFSPPGQAIARHSRDFYRVDDVIQTFFSKSSVRGLLRQPSPGVASAFCFSRNPAKFLRSSSLSCTRMVTSDSCTTDPNLRASSYFSNMNLIKVPTAAAAIPSDLLIPVTPLSDWPAPVNRNGSCMNVVKNVEFTVYFTARGEITNGIINIKLADVVLDQLVLQTHSVQYQFKGEEEETLGIPRGVPSIRSTLATPRPTPAEAAPPTGLRLGSALIGRFNGELQTLTSLGVSEGGECSSDPSTRLPVLFTHNTITGCTLSSPTQNCTELRSHIYETLRGSAAPDVIAMNSGSQPDWTRVITQECPINPQESGDSGCTIPHSLFIQVLWARQGFIEHPQNFILGAKFLFHCQNVQVPLSSPLTLMAKTAFVETTIYPEPPRGVPQPYWRFPFGFFTRGAAELDGHVVTCSSGAQRVSWGLMLLLVGLAFFTSKTLT